MHRARIFQSNRRPRAAIYDSWIISDSAEQIPEKRKRPYVRPVTTTPIAADERQTAAMLSISPRLFRDLVKDKKVTPIRIPGVRRVVYDVDELRSLVQRWKQGA
jgi:hypothetical protein